MKNSLGLTKRQTKTVIDKVTETTTVMLTCLDLDEYHNLFLKTFQELHTTKPDMAETYVKLVLQNYARVRG